ncbi:MAG: SIS domain-containing protein [Spirochaetaceae bacterium]|jgi:6-phospho-3-hexuloisomerase|nr:SIS domain-containing protein [Spirochaetaceae bacterium]
MSEELFVKFRNIILGEVGRALGGIDPRSVAELTGRIVGARKVFCTGVGRVLLSLEAFTKRLAHLGIDAHFVGEITEPAVTKEDLLIAGSGSGESLVPLSIVRKAKSLGVPVAHIGSNPQSSMAPYTDLMVRIPVRTKLSLDDEINSQQPMTSLFEQSLLILGDIIACIIVEKKGLDLHSLWQYHANLE